MERQRRLQEVFAIVRIAPSLLAQPPREPAPESPRPDSLSQQSSPVDISTSQRNHATNSESSGMSGENLSSSRDTGDISGSGKVCVVGMKGTNEHLEAVTEVWHGVRRPVILPSVMLHITKIYPDN